jgi:hypothetical protein
MFLHQNLRPAVDMLKSLPWWIRDNAILAGGALRAAFDGTEVKDYDLFFRSEEHFQFAVRILQQHMLYAEGADAGRTKLFVCVENGYQINLVGFAFGTPEETMARFDFRCCRMALYVDNLMPTFSAEPGAVEDAQTKTLNVLICNGEDRTVRRIEHYENDYGYTVVVPEVPSDDFDIDDPLADIDDPRYVPAAQPPVPKPDREVRVRRYIRTLPQHSGGY